MGYYSSLILLLPAIILTLYAQVRVKTAFNKYSKIANTKGASGLQVAQMILYNNGLGQMPINLINGNLSDNYNPRTKSLNLSAQVYGGSSIAAIAVAAHECGHAIQDNTNYGLLKFRNNIVPVVNLGSNLAWPLIIIGLIFSMPGLQNAGVILFSAVVLFHLVTLPVEINASKRGLQILKDAGLLVTNEDAAGAKAVLGAAALTYVAALATALANLLRILLLTRNSRR